MFRSFIDAGWTFIMSTTKDLYALFESAEIRRKRRVNLAKDIISAVLKEELITNELTVTWYAKHDPTDLHSTYFGEVVVDGILFEFNGCLDVQETDPDTTPPFKVMMSFVDTETRRNWSEWYIVTDINPPYKLHRLAI